MAEAEIVDPALFICTPVEDRLELRSFVMPVRQIETDRTAAAAAIVAVTLAKRRDAPLFLLTAVFPRSYIFGDDRRAHEM